AGNSTSAFKLYIDEKSITDAVTLPQTADNKWDTYKTIDVKEKVALKAGKHVLKLEITSNYANIDWIQFSEPKKDSIPDAIANVRFDMTEAESNFSAYNMQGQKLGTFTAKGMAHAMDLLKTDAKLRKQAQGVFFIRKNGTNSMSKKVVVYE
ncbi:MAG: carbohydrate-binding protein, partial [Fibrobacter sp.]|nr:carbohydrate-binding protein [Fibrobacter sp.]